jgi:predicted GNAT family N-acyltransferase
VTVTIADTAADRQAAFDIRRAVFIEEQAIPEAEEWDHHDATATHLLLRIEGRPAATARLIAEGDTVKIGRVAVMPAQRGTGLGRRLIAQALELAAGRGFRRAALEAQVQAIAFYERLGFVAEGPEFDDGSGILHRRMTRALARPGTPANHAGHARPGASPAHPEGAT